MSEPRPLSLKRLVRLSLCHFSLNSRGLVSGPGLDFSSSTSSPRHFICPLPPAASFPTRGPSSIQRPTPLRLSFPPRQKEVGEAAALPPSAQSPPSLTRLDPGSLARDPKMSGLATKQQSLKIFEKLKTKSANKVHSTEQPRWLCPLRPASFFFFSFFRETMSSHFYFIFIFIFCFQICPMTKYC